MSVPKAKQGIPFDNERFKESLADRGLRSVDIATEMGHANSYFSTISTKRGGVLLPVEARFLETEYGIKPEDYAPKKPAESKTVDPLLVYNTLRMIVREELNSALRSDWFREIIQNAQKSAVLIQMEKEREEYRRMITAAVYNTVTDGDVADGLREIVEAAIVNAIK